jgi:aspartyl-tRNA(Asn)/glutamyl-tRNA(Gln) amidotransferase subunit B
LDVSDCEMQEGSLRVDANVNLHINVDGKIAKTPIVEIKNMNSFRAVERAIAYETERQYDVWTETGATIEKNPKTTRGWDDGKEQTFPQREKEESADYRYFPDPDLLPVRIPESRIEQIRSELGELPAQTRERLERQYSIKAYDADVIVNQGRAMIAYFESAAAISGDGRRTSAWLQQDVMRTMKERDIEIGTFPVSSLSLGELVRRISANELETTRGRDVFNYMVDHPQASVESATDALGIKAVDTSEIDNLCDELLAANPQVIADVRAGKMQALGMLIGQSKKKNPNANPQLVRETLLAKINSASP